MRSMILQMNHLRVLVMLKKVDVTKQSDLQSSQEDEMGAIGRTKIITLMQRTKRKMPTLKTKKNADAILLIHRAI